jgi:phosphoglycolate phosphatase-like HAD superfamily hydrolase
LRTLILFDIDATLITTSGVGVKAMIDAGAELFGPGFHADGVAFAGRLDPLILVDLLQANGVAPTPDAMSGMRVAYRSHLAQRLPTVSARTLPGVDALLCRLEDFDRLTTGLLTGNFPETGRMKLEACGLRHERFLLQVWGDDSPHQPPSRDHLPPVAIERFRARNDSEAPDRVVIIGDTPHDVACARVNGCRCIGVATGRHSPEDLKTAGADLVLPDLSNTAQVVEWLCA